MVNLAATISSDHPTHRSIDNNLKTNFIEEPIKQYSSKNGNYFLVYPSDF